MVTVQKRLKVPGLFWCYLKGTSTQTKVNMLLYRFSIFAIKSQQMNSCQQVQWPSLLRFRIWANLPKTSSTKALVPPTSTDVPSVLFEYFSLSDFLRLLAPQATAF